MYSASFLSRKSLFAATVIAAAFVTTKADGQAHLMNLYSVSKPMQLDLTHLATVDPILIAQLAQVSKSLPAQQPGPMGLAWSTQGRFLPGQVQSGNRVLVYAGPITTPFMEDTLSFQFTLDGTLMRHAVPVTYHFEMDED